MFFNFSKDRRHSKRFQISFGIATFNYMPSCPLLEQYLIPGTGRFLTSHRNSFSLRIFNLHEYVMGKF